MREITKNLTIPVDGKKLDFRLTKLDAFSGASLLRMLSKMPEDSLSTPHNVKRKSLTLQAFSHPRQWEFQQMGPGYGH